MTCADEWWPGASWWTPQKSRLGWYDVPALAAPGARVAWAHMNIRVRGRAKVGLFAAFAAAITNLRARAP